MGQGKRTCCSWHQMPSSLTAKGSRERLSDLSGTHLDRLLHGPPASPPGAARQPQANANRPQWRPFSSRHMPPWCVAQPSHRPGCAPPLAQPAGSPSRARASARCSTRPAPARSLAGPNEREHEERRSSARPLGRETHRPSRATPRRRRCTQSADRCGRAALDVQRSAQRQAERIGSGQDVSPHDLPHNVGFAFWSRGGPPPNARAGTQPPEARGRNGQVARQNCLTARSS